MLIALAVVSSFAGPMPQQPATKPAPAAATDTASPDSVVAALYATISGERGKARDWDRLRSLFAPDGRLVAMVKAQGGMRPALLTVDDYVHRAGPSLERDGFFEREIARRQQVFGDIAHVFSTYECRRALADAAPFLRGINSIQLVHTGGQWRVLQILWEQEVDAGPIPREFLTGLDPAAAPPLAVRVRCAEPLRALAQRWVAAEHGAGAAVTFAIASGGGAAFTAFTRGEADVVVAMRGMREPERAAARASGFEPVEVCIGQASMAIVVHADNPVAQLRLDQLRELFRDGGALTKWSQLGIALPAGASDDVQLVGRPADSGAAIAFRGRVLGGDDALRGGLVAAKDSAAVIVAVSAQPNAIGFVEPERAAAASGVRVVPLVAAPGEAAVLPAAGDRYPLTRPAFVCYRAEPSGRIAAFVAWLTSDAGKALLAEHGLSPR